MASAVSATAELKQENEMTHQLDRIEEMLMQLVGTNQPDVIRKSDVSRAVIELFGFIVANKKIEAIKLCRALTGYGLKESKDIIMAMYSLRSDHAA